LRANRSDCACRSVAGPGRPLGAIPDDPTLVLAWVVRSVHPVLAVAVTERGGGWGVPLGVSPGVQSPARGGRGDLQFLFCLAAGRSRLVGGPHTLASPQCMLRGRPHP